MNKLAALIVALFLPCSLPLLAQKKAPPPKAIRFQGATQYTQEELLAASGIKPGARLSAIEVKARAKQLNDTGLFAVVKFGSDSKGLLFTLTPAGQLFPIHLDNLPLTPGKELDDKLHERLPLYHGLVPANGSMVEGICQAFEEMLAGEGVKATVKAALTSDLGPQKITAMNFTITAPSIYIGAIQLSGVSAAMQAKVNGLVAAQTGNGFDTENSAAGLKRAFEDLYQDQGYAAVQVDVAEVNPLIVSDQTVDIPYAVAIREGGIYKLGAINYPADAIVSRSEVERIQSKYQAGSGRPLDLFLLAVRDAYHAKGYLDCSVVPRPSFNEATHVVNYGVDIDAGPVYKMGTVQFDGAGDAMAAKLTHIWKMAPGDAFDEGYVSTFATRAQKQDRSVAKWMQTVITTYNVKADPASHEVNCVYHFAKAAQGGR